MSVVIDVLENEIRKRYPGILEILIKDQTTGNNILWATDNYSNKGRSYYFNSTISVELITGKNGQLIKPRVQKDKELQRSRSRTMAEVFTPSWICNTQNNIIDNSWFERDNVFNSEYKDTHGKQYWQVNPQIITFPENKNWRDYILDRRLEMACGEGPYITSRYDTTTGDYIEIPDRIGIIDRKLRVVNENVDVDTDWLTAVEDAYKSTYAFEWQGDSLLLAREAMLMTFIENFTLKFEKEPSLESIKSIAEIISWNIWQMDGIKGVVPNTCSEIEESSINLFGEKEIRKSGCIGCKQEDIFKHNGTYTIIKDWTLNITKSAVPGKKIRFIDLLKKHRK